MHGEDDPTEWSERVFRLAAACLQSVVLGCDARRLRHRAESAVEQARALQGRTATSPYPMLGGSDEGPGRRHLQLVPGD